ncbi:hypothetical protein [Halomonas salinarum]|nr:hypothetical protein [Halomonas salinarum]
MMIAATRIATMMVATMMAVTMSSIGAMITTVTAIMTIGVVFVRQDWR